MTKLHYLPIVVVIAMATIFLGSCKKQQDLQTPKQQTASTNNGDFVLVPGAGLVPKAQVHIIEQGYHLSIEGTHILKVENVSGKVMLDFGAVHSPVSHTPSTTIQSSKKIDLSTATPGNIVGANPNWITWAQWTNPSGQPPINHVSSTWVVPSAPTTNHGQTLFIFNGLETTSGSDILQPVLQWGPSAAGGGSYWAIANWFVASGFYAVQMPLITVSSNTSLTGVMNYTGQQSGTGSYNYTSSFTGYNNALTLVDGANVNTSSGTTPYVPLQTTAVETLEAYASTGPPPLYSTDYPPDYDVRMTNIQVTTSNGNSSLSWLPQNNVTGFGQQTIVVSNSSPGGEVDLYFHTPPPPPTAIAEIDISHGDSVYYWTKAGMVSAGSSTNSVLYRSPVSYTLPTGKTPANIVGIAIASSNWCYYWYSDGTMSVGTTTNATAHIAPQTYVLPSGKTPADILAISIAKNTDQVYTWYRDGTATVGNSTNLAAIRSAYAYTLDAGESISTVVGIGIAGSNSHCYAWYSDHKVSSGITNQLDYYFTAVPASF